MEPIGIAARDLQECCCYRFTEKKEETYVTEILKNHFESFANHDYDKIMESMEISKSELQHAKDVINKLDPKPGYIDNEFLQSLYFTRFDRYKRKWGIFN